MNINVFNFPNHSTVWLSGYLDKLKENLKHSITDTLHSDATSGLFYNRS